ncbi:ABC transporter permease [Ancylobacter sp. MQZ15Z-1]|uniref:ABC transporter permease n=1 Tax=Ancylobacter mangrovi TaxID=2972472 RepID=A0A9X2PGD9_9HYPH|nr:ABC transporter permease [Ancylobacter mangrovi]MCS0495525.1 ABC transporter permease [Ancylobacter mangrovi]
MIGASREMVRRHGGWWVANAVVSALVMVFLLAPVLAVIPLSFSSGTFLHYPLPGLSLRWYDEVLASGPWRRALMNSLIVASSSAALASVLGISAALGISRLSGKLATALTAFLLAPMIAPVIIVAFGLFILFSQFGLVATYTGLILAHTLVATPMVLITVSAALRTLDPRLARASASLGASPVRGFFTVTLPLILPGVLSGVLLAFVTSFDEIVLTLFISGPEQRTLPRYIFENLRENIDPSIIVVSTFLVVFAAVLLFVMQALRGRAGTA